VDEAKRAYHEVEALEDENAEGGVAVTDGGQKCNDAKCNKTNCREVGHNIYILAHQVFVHIVFDGTKMRNVLLTQVEWFTVVVHTEEDLCSHHLAIIFIYKSCV